MYSNNNSPTIRYVLFTVGLGVGTVMLNNIWNTPALQARRAGAKLPPGPKRELLIGNMRNFPKKQWYETFSQWKEEYGAS
jgi:hypothetical protein